VLKVRWSRNILIFRVIWFARKDSMLKLQNLNDVASCGSTVIRPLSFAYAFTRPVHTFSADPGSELQSSHIHMSKEHLDIEIDIISFSPEEITVSSVDDVLIIKGGPAWHNDACREFTRKIKLPVNADIDAIKCKIGDEGTLNIHIPVGCPRMRHKLRSRRNSNGSLKTHQIHVQSPRSVPQIWVNGVDCGKHKFVVRLNLPNFNPDDISIKAENGFLVVDGCHEQGTKNGKTVLSSSFHYRYLLPMNADKNEIQAEMDVAGELLIRLPRTADSNQ